MRICNSRSSCARTDNLVFPLLVKAIPRYSNSSPTLNARRGVRLIKKVFWSVRTFFSLPLGIKLIMKHINKNNLFNFQKMAFCGCVH